MAPDPLARKYKISDPYMLEFAKSLRLWFVTDQVDFVAEDSNYAAPFEVDWQTAITDAEAISSDEQRKDQLTQLTANVLAEMKNCQDVFQSAKRYIKKAFPDSVEHWNEFGFDDYDNVGRSQPKMIQFMNRLHSTAVKYTAELTAPAVNFTAARITEIETTKANLDKANNNQEVFKKDMLTHTRERVEAMNAVWATCTDVAEVGKQLYSDQYDKYQHYLLPASEETATMLLSGVVTDSVTGAPIVDVLAELTAHALQSETDSLGAYGFGNPPSGDTHLRVTATGYTQQDINLTIDPDNPLVINVQLVAVL
ncbi:MAG: hypothetical protein ACI9P8_001290 [Bacteroidia bacterium]|jgi:hypothetical protein